MRVATVLRTGGDFGPLHVYAIRRMLRRYMPGVEFMCLTDVEGMVPGWRWPLRHGWPGWWAKMELCRPDIEGTVLYMDLDTVVVGDMAPLVEDVSRSVVLRDLFRGRGGRGERKVVQSALMLLTEEDRAAVWEVWMDRGPQEWMAERRVRSDQDVFERVLADRVEYWQDTHPGMVRGYKSEIRRNGDRVPEGCRVVVFHGHPRPWESGVEWAERPFW